MSELCQVRSTECGVGTLPIPVSDWTAGEFVALLVKDKFPEAAPLACGVKVTVKEADVPAARVIGNEIPDRTNSLAMLSDEIVTAAPVAFRVPLSEELEPTTTLPKLKVAGETLNIPGALPMPESTTLSGELHASETIDTAPLGEPALVGAKVTVKVRLWFEERVVGKVNPLTEKTLPVILAWEIVTAVPPVFVTVSDLLLLLPT